MSAMTPLFDLSDSETFTKKSPTIKRTAVKRTNVSPQMSNKRLPNAMESSDDDVRTRKQKIPQISDHSETDNITPEQATTTMKLLRSRKYSNKMSQPSTHVLLSPTKKSDHMSRPVSPMIVDVVLSTRNSKSPQQKPIKEDQELDSDLMKGKSSDQLQKSLHDLVDSDTQPAEEQLATLNPQEITSPINITRVNSMEESQIAELKAKNDKCDVQCKVDDTKSSTTTKKKKNRSGVPIIHSSLNVHDHDNNMHVANSVSIPKHEVIALPRTTKMEADVPSILAEDRLSQAVRFSNNIFVDRSEGRTQVLCCIYKY